MKKIPDEVMEAYEQIGRPTPLIRARKYITTIINIIEIYQ